MTDLLQEGKMDDELRAHNLLVKHQLLSELIYTPRLTEVMVDFARAECGQLLADLYGLQDGSLLRDLRAECERLREENERLTRQLDEVTKFSRFFHASVGECHLLISRGGYELGPEWGAGTLPARVNELLKQRAPAVIAAAPELLEALVEDE